MSNGNRNNDSKSSRHRRREVIENDLKIPHHKTLHAHDLQKIIEKHVPSNGDHNYFNSDQSYLMNQIERLRDLRDLKYVSKSTTKSPPHPIETPKRVGSDNNEFISDLVSQLRLINKSLPFHEDLTSMDVNLLEKKKDLNYFITHPNI